MRAGGDHGTRDKADKSPVTDADEAAEAVILAGLRKLTPDAVIIAEEEMAAGRVPTLVEGQPFWLVDPLDGTKEFIKRNGEFTVNIALIEDGRPTLGIVLAPATDTLWRGAKGLGADKQNACAGQGVCASVKHDCAQQNDCKHQGGCGAAPGYNDCKQQGGCAVPMSAGMWEKARARFEQQMKEQGKQYAAAPAAKDT